MNLKEAIEALEFAISRYPHILEDETLQAMKLGIEALKDFKRHRGRVESGHYRILPGETED